MHCCRYSCCRCIVVDAVGSAIVVLQVQFNMAGGGLVHKLPAFYESDKTSKIEGSQTFFFVLSCYIMHENLILIGAIW